MICKDMKYTALYWALRFFEVEEDIHQKSYSGYTITINAEAQTVDYGDKIKVISGELKYLKRHKDFVVLECVDRLLKRGVMPADILLDGRKNNPDIIVKDRHIYCEQWGEDYEKALQKFAGDGVLYTSRLVSGLIEYRTSDMKIKKVEGGKDFDILNDELIFYRGKDKVVRVPEGIKSIAASAFWNNTYIEEVILPESLLQLGGDCFYCCYNLKKVNIPKNLQVMGNNPFAGCPELVLTNDSPYFNLKDGVLYSADGTNLIYYPILKKEQEFIIPQGVICIGKHSFFLCDNLKKIVIPSTVARMENNPFSGCTNLEIENHSCAYHFENGIIYNAYFNTIIGCLNGTKIDRFVVPESVTLISRNSFWNCKGIKNIVVTKNVTRIGYNPFAGCPNLLLESLSPLFPCRDGIIYDKDFTHILCATNLAVGKVFRVKDSVTHINRGVFSGCTDLEKIDLCNVTYIDKSAFTNCISLKEVYIPDGVTYIGEWAFAHCTALEKISIPKATFIDKNAFNECHVKIERRD